MEYGLRAKYSYFNGSNKQSYIGFGKEIIRMLSIQELSRMSSITVRTLRSDMKAGLLKGEMVSGKWMFSDENLKEYFGNNVIRQRIKAKVHSPLYTFIDALGASKPPACFIFDVHDREEAEWKNETVAQYVQGFSDHNVAYTYYYDETRKCGRFILIGTLEFVMGAIRRLEGEAE